MSLNKNIKNDVRKFLSEDDFYSESLPKDFADSFGLLESGALDSIGVFNLIVFLESNFRIKIGIDELSEANFANLLQIERFVTSKIDASNAAQ